MPIVARTAVEPAHSKIKERHSDDTARPRRVKSGTGKPKIDVGIEKKIKRQKTWMIQLPQCYLFGVRQ